jgi:preprotein translocase subunit SecY
MVFTIVLLLVTLASLLWSTPVNVAVSVPVRLLITAVLIVFFTFLYTAFVCDPEQMAARLAACGGELPGIAPGEETAAYLDGAISRMAALGAVYLLSVILLPELLGRFLGLPITLDGTPVLLLVCVVLDLAAEFRAYRARPE